MSVPNWKSGFTRIRPGVYDDGKGGLHIDEEEMLDANGYEVTPENIRTLREALREMAKKGDFRVHEEDHE